MCQPSNKCSCQQRCHTKPTCHDGQKETSMCTRSSFREPGCYFPVAPSTSLTEQPLGRQFPFYWGRPIVQSSLRSDCGLRHTRLPFPDHYNRRQPGGYRVSRLIPPLNATVTDSIRDVNVPRDVAKNTYAISVRDRIFFPNIIFVAQPKHPVFSTNLPSPSPPNLPSPVKVERLRILLYG